MTELEKAVADELRLSNVATQSLLPAIQRHIESAKAELIRSGISADMVDSESGLIVDCIICWVLSKMGEESDREWYLGIFRNQQDNIRKSQ